MQSHRRDLPIVSELHARITKTGMITQVACPYKEKRQFHGSTYGFTHAEDDQCDKSNTSAGSIDRGDSGKMVGT